MRTAELKVMTREEGSKSINRRLRREGMVPANIYGAGKTNAYCAFDERDLKRAIGGSTAGNLILSLSSDSKDLQGKRVLLKSLEKDPLSWASVHADFYEVSLDRPIEVHIPLEFVGTPTGVKLGGGIFQIVRRSVTVKGLVDDIPDSLQVDVSALDLNHSLHVSDLKISDKVMIVDSAKYTIASVSEPQKEEVVAPVAAAAAEGDAAAPAAGAEAAAPAEASGDKK